MKFVITVKNNKAVVDCPENFSLSDCNTLYSGAAKKICYEVCNMAEISCGDVDEIHNEFLNHCLVDFPYYKY